MKILRLEEIDSTNRFLMQRAAEFGDEDVVLVAKNQTAGRGMGSNSWESEGGKNLLFSILIHPSFVPVQQQFLLSMTMAVALREGIAPSKSPRGKAPSKSPRGETFVAKGEGMMDEGEGRRDEGEGMRGEGPLTIKWPNDIYWNDRKLSGTLIDLSISSKGIHNLVIGTGVNVNQRVFVSDAPNPVSLWQIMGTECSIDGLLDSIMAAFDRWYGVLRSGDTERIVAEYHKHLYRRTGFHTYEDSAGRFEAETVGVRTDGRLVLRCKDGTVRDYEIKTIKFIHY